MKLPPELTLLRDGVAVRRGHEAEVDGWLAAARADGRGPAGRTAQGSTARWEQDDDTAALVGGRGTTRVVALAGGGRAFVRRYVHGGLLGSLLGDLYWERPPRPWREAIATEAARAAGVIAPEVLAAAVLPAASGLLYRGVLVTRALEGRRALGNVLRAARDATERDAWIACAVRAVAQLHGAGIHHPDLNVANVLVADSPGEPAALIDFDRATVGEGTVGELQRALARRRLSRSIAKLGLPGLDRDGAQAALRAAGLGVAS